MFDWWEAFDLFDWLMSWRFWLCMTVTSLVIILLYYRLPDSPARWIVCSLIALAGVIAGAVWESNCDKPRR